MSEEDFKAGMLEERAHQNALSLLVMKKYTDLLKEINKQVDELEKIIIGQREELAAAKKHIADLENYVNYLTAPLPPFEACDCAHRFTAEGVCIRCGIDAEEWDAGCVEEIWRRLEKLDKVVKEEKPIEIEL